MTGPGRHLRTALLLTALTTSLACGEPPRGSADPARAAAPRAAATEGPATARPLLADVTAAAGIDFAHWNGMVGAFDFVETMGAGGALFDADGDGDLDLYLIQGTHLHWRDGTPTRTPPPEPLTDRLYRNDTLAGGSPRFVDVTARSGQLGDGYGMGVASGDVDNDGDVDLYITNDGANQLLINRGDGTFERAMAAGADDDRLSIPAAFFDADGDGWLDLYIGNYLEIPHPEPACHDTTGGKEYCGPSNFTPLPDRLLRNRGRGPSGWSGFADVTAAAGLGAPAAALGAVTADLDQDGRIDLYVANDGYANQLWMNRGEPGAPRFEDRAVLAGCAVNGAGTAEGSMGVDAADLDADGDLDLFMTHLIAQSNTLFRNDGEGMFQDASAVARIAAPSRPYTSFGTGALDLGNDGKLDLVVLSGAVNTLPELVRAGDPYPLHQANQVFVALGNGRFADATERAGPAFASSEVSRGAVFGDVDNDGDTDVVVVNNNGAARLLIDPAGQARAWIGLRPVLGSPSRDALGATVRLTPPDRIPRPRRVATDGSYASARDPRVVFGLGDDRAPQSVTVTWPDGSVERFDDLATGRYHTLAQGSDLSAD